MIGDKDLGIVSKMLDFYALRHKLIAHNMANAEVPGFRRLDLHFEDALLEAVQKGDTAKVQNAGFVVEKAAHEGVDAESEVAKMVKNQLLFDTFSQIAAHNFRMLRMAIQSK